jgi:uncharacterized protein with GYD domain
MVRGCRVWAGRPPGCTPKAGTTHADGIQPWDTSAPPSSRHRITAKSSRRPRKTVRQSGVIPTGGSANERKDDAALSVEARLHAEDVATLIGNPEDRRKAAQSYGESVSGSLHGFWYAFGGHDGYNLWEAPDNASMAAVASAISAGGAFSSFGTTVLMSGEETMDALRMAADVPYQAPAAPAS